MVQTISQYLGSHKLLVVPQLGTFIVKEPGVSIVFSELLKRDDGVLRGLLREAGVGELEAAGEIDRFVFEVRHAAQHGQEFRLDGFGGHIDRDIARLSLSALNIDQYGLDEIDNKILLTIIDKFRGGPVGVSTIATAIGEDTGTVEEVYEPYLIMEGFIKRTPRGRMVTPLAYQHLGRPMMCNNTAEPTLFD